MSRAPLGCSWWHQKMRTTLAGTHSKYWIRLLVRNSLSNKIKKNSAVFAPKETLFHSNAAELMYLQEPQYTTFQCIFGQSDTTQKLQAYDGSRWYEIKSYSNLWKISVILTSTACCRAKRRGLSAAAACRRSYQPASNDTYKI